MSDWYVSSVTYAAIPVWAATTAYTVGQLIKPTAPPASGNGHYVFRCTVAGTSAASEPTWSTASANNATRTDGTVTWTNVTGQSTYGWSAAAGTLAVLANNGRPLVGDRVFLSSDHSESISPTSWSFNNLTDAFGLIQIISVNRAGSVPPSASDILNGASIAQNSSVVNLNAYCDLFWQGITISCTSSHIAFNSGGTKAHYFKNCAFVFNNTSTSARFGNNGGAKVVLDNTTIQFGAAAQTISPLVPQPFDLHWINTPSAIVGATLPTTLFNNGQTTSMSVTCRGVDLSAIVGTLLNSQTASEITKVLLDSCKIASGVTRYTMTSITAAPAYDEIELVNCFDGTNIINERHAPAGDLTIDRSTTLNGGAQDDVGGYSFKLVSTVRSDICTMPLDGFWLDVENAAIGSSKTATVEIISSATLNNNDIKFQLEYPGTSGSTRASFTESLASVLTAAAALPTSSATWTVSVSYTTLNSADKDTHITLSGGDLTALGTAGWTGFARALDGKSTSKFYKEYIFNATQTQSGVGVAISSLPVATTTFSGSVVAGHSGLIRTGLVYVDGSSVFTIDTTAGSSISFGTIASGTVICVALDMAAKKIWFRLGASGNWNNLAGRDPATGVGGAIITNVTTAYPTICMGGADTIIANFGASAFVGAVPSGFTSGWPNTPASKQLLQVTFTPQAVGRVRGLVRLGKVSTTVWINPQLVIA